MITRIEYINYCKRMLALNPTWTHIAQDSESRIFWYDLPPLLGISAWDISKEGGACGWLGNLYIQHSWRDSLVSRKDLTKEGCLHHIQGNEEIKILNENEINEIARSCAEKIFAERVNKILDTLKGALCK